MCESTSVDSNDQTLSMFRVLEEINAEIHYPKGTQEPKDPVIPLAFTIVSYWERSDLDVAEPDDSFDVRVVDPSGKVIFVRTQQFSIVDPHKRMRAVQRIQLLPAKASGRYEVQLLVPRGKSKTGKMKVASIPLEVRIKTVEDVIPVSPNSS